MLSDTLKKFEKEAIKKGRKEGMEKGMEIGKKETAEKMLRKNMEINIIAECTGFTVEFLKKLKEEVSGS